MTVLCNAPYLQCTAPLPSTPPTYSPSPPPPHTHPPPHTDSPHDGDGAQRRLQHGHVALRMLGGAARGGAVRVGRSAVRGGGAAGRGGTGREVTALLLCSHPLLVSRSSITQPSSGPPCLGSTHSLHHLIAPLLTSARHAAAAAAAPAAAAPAAAAPAGGWTCTRARARLASRRCRGAWGSATSWR